LFSLLNLPRAKLVPFDRRSGQDRSSPLLWLVCWTAKPIPFVQPFVCSLESLIFMMHLKGLVRLHPRIWGFRGWCFWGRSQESYFQYVFGVLEEENCYGAIDLRSGDSLLFIPKHLPTYAVWSGHIHTPEEIKVGSVLQRRHFFWGFVCFGSVLLSVFGVFSPCVGHLFQPPRPPSCQSTAFLFHLLILVGPFGFSMQSHGLGASLAVPSGKHARGPVRDAGIGRQYVVG
jgi:Aminopeptidase P, N-terminal domain